MKHTLTPEERARGGRNTHKAHGMRVCHLCKGRGILNTGFHESAGAKGAEAMHSRHSTEEFRQWGQQGGRGRKKSGNS